MVSVTPVRKIVDFSASRYADELEAGRRISFSMVNTPAIANLHLREKVDVDDLLAANIARSPFACVQAHYERRLLENDRATTFLKSNRLFVFSGFALGFADRTLGRLLPEGGEATRQRQRLKDLQILLPSGHEALRGCVTAALRGPDGEVTGMVGLPIAHPPSRTRTIGTGLLHADTFSQFDEVILCRCPVDTLTLIAAGFENAIAVVGMDARAFDWTRLRRVITLGAIADGSCFDCFERFHIRMPDGLSAARLVRESGDPTLALGDRIRTATWLHGSTESRIAAKPGPARKPIASPDPADLSANLIQSTDGVELVMADREWSVQGFDPSSTGRSMKATLKIQVRAELCCHIDTVDLMSWAARRRFATNASSIVRVDAAVLNSDLAVLLRQLDSIRLAHRQNQAARHDAAGRGATSFLKAANLTGRIVDDLQRLGIPGQPASRLAAYIAFVVPGCIISSVIPFEPDQALAFDALREVLGMNVPKAVPPIASMREHETLKGWQADETNRRLKSLHRTVVDLLQPAKVINPFADQLRFPESCTSGKAGFAAYLNLIRSITLLHQYQREPKHATIDGKLLPYLEVLPQDISLANTIAEPWFRPVQHALPPATADALETLRRWSERRAKADRGKLHDRRFTRRDACEALGVGLTATRRHLERLCLAGKIHVHQGRFGQRYRYGIALAGCWPNRSTDIDQLTSASELVDPAVFALKTGDSP